MEVQKIIKESLQRIGSKRVHGLGFIDYFYKIFLGSSGLVRDYFKGTDLKKQALIMKKSISELVFFYGDQKITKHIHDIGKSHNMENLNIAPEMYDLWLDALMYTVKEFDDQFSSEVELAWHLVLAPGIAYMKYAYNHPDLPLEE